MITANANIPQPEQNDFEKAVDIIINSWFDNYAPKLLNSEEVETLKNTLKISLQELI